MSEYDREPRHVCTECFADQGIRNFIQQYAESKECSFCGTVGEEPIAAKFRKVSKHINDSLYREYDDAANGMAYDSAEGGYLGQTWTTWELLEKVGLELPQDDGSLLDALIERLDENNWSQSDPYGLTHLQETEFSWNQFSRVVKHQRRYFFRGGDRGRAETLSPGEILEMILDYAEKISLLVEIEPAALKIFRARWQERSGEFQTPLDLGPPPVEKATQANRMSPAGVVMFYGSDHVDTALRETAQSSGPGVYAVGEYSNVRQIVLLNLADLPDIPSLFEEIPDTLEFNPRLVLQFLHHVSWEMSQPIERDGREHIEYVPSQVVTEFVRSTNRERGKVDGIRYSSAVHGGAASYVLFADQDNVVVPDDTHSAFRSDDRWLKLVARSEQTVSDEDIGNWQQDRAIDFSD